MLRYRLNKMANRKGDVALGVLESSVGTERQYYRILRGMIAQLGRVVREEVIPVAEAELRRKPLTIDADFSIFEQLGRYGDAFARAATDMVMRILRLESKRHTKQFMAMAKRTLGVDLKAVVSEEDLTEALDTMAARNAALIKGLAQETIRRVQQTVTQSVLNGGNVKDLRRQLSADFGFGDRRAKLIARDQTAKLTSDLNRIRHTQAGITKYTWRTSQDERVRPLHRKLNGRIYAYGEPTGAEQGLPPGQPIQCRCVAIPIVEF